MQKRRRLRPLLAGLFGLAACASQGRVYDGVDERAPAPTEDAISGGPVVEPSSAPSTAPSAVAGSDGSDACLMLYECGCNSGCVSVEAPRRGLREGVLARVTAGNLKGEQLWVAKQRTALGDEIFTVQQRDPKDEIQVCGTSRRNALGYACATDGVGLARRCSTCPAE